MILIYSLIFITFTLFLYFGIPWLHGRYSRWQLKWETIGAKAIVLTFDDGPGGRLAPLVLKILAENNGHGVATAANGVYSAPCKENCRS